jgi:hypothetical protein
VPMYDMTLHSTTWLLDVALLVRGVLRCQQTLGVLAAGPMAASCTVSVSLVGCTLDRFRFRVCFTAVFGQVQPLDWQQNYQCCHSLPRHGCDTDAAPSLPCRVLAFAREYAATTSCGSILGHGANQCHLTGRPRRAGGRGGSLSSCRISDGLVSRPVRFSPLQSSKCEGRLPSAHPLSAMPQALCLMRSQG